MPACKQGRSIYWLIDCVMLQGLQTNLSSQGSPSLSTGPFGTHMANSSAGANGNSPALSNNSVPSIAPNGQSFYANPGSVSLVDQLARPSGLDRIDSGSEPGMSACLRACMSVSPGVCSISLYAVDSVFSILTGSCQHY